jgi:hypothetical protein
VERLPQPLAGHARQVDEGLRRAHDRGLADLLPHCGLGCSFSLFLDRVFILTAGLAALPQRKNCQRINFIRKFAVINKPFHGHFLYE